MSEEKVSPITREYELRRHADALQTRFHQYTSVKDQVQDTTGFALTDRHALPQAPSQHPLRYFAPVHTSPRPHRNLPVADAVHLSDTAPSLAHVSSSYSSSMASPAVSMVSELTRHFITTQKFNTERSNHLEKSVQYLIDSVSKSQKRSEDEMKDMKQMAERFHVLEMNAFHGMLNRIEKIEQWQSAHENVDPGVVEKLNRVEKTLQEVLEIVNDRHAASPLKHDMATSPHVQAVTRVDQGIDPLVLDSDEVMTLNSEQNMQFQRISHSPQQLPSLVIPSLDQYIQSRFSTAAFSPQCLIPVDWSGNPHHDSSDETLSPTPCVTRVSSPVNVVHPRSPVVLPAMDNALDSNLQPSTPSTVPISGAESLMYHLTTDISQLPPPTTLGDTSLLSLTGLNSNTLNDSSELQTTRSGPVVSFFTPRESSSLSLPAVDDNAKAQHLAPGVDQNPQTLQLAREITTSPPLPNIPLLTQADTPDFSFAMFKRGRSRSRSLSSLSSLTELSVRSMSVGPRNTVAAAKHMTQDSGAMKRPKKRQRTDAGHFSSISASSNKKRRGRSQKFPLRVSSTVTASRGSNETLDNIKSTHTRLNGNQCKWPDKLSAAGMRREFIQCDKCDNWYHLGCVGICSGDSRLQPDAEFICPPCNAQFTDLNVYRTSTIENAACARPDCDAPLAEEFIVDKFIGRKPYSSSSISKAEREYIWLILWEGYTAAYATWCLPEDMPSNKAVFLARFNEEASAEGYSHLLNDPDRTVLLKEASDAGWI